MNRKNYKIYKDWREKKYSRDLEVLQNDLANRGMVSSGIRIKEERWLKNELDADLKRKEQEMLDYEKERSDEAKTRKNQRRTNIALVVGLIFGLIINAGFYLYSAKIDGEINRPYLEIDSSGMQEQLSISRVDPKLTAEAIWDNTSYPVNDSFSFVIHNIGKLPARYHVDLTDFNWAIIDRSLPPANKDGFIFPGQKIELVYDLKGVVDHSDSEERIFEAKERMDALIAGEFKNASKINIQYSYIEDEVDNKNYRFKTVIAERVVEYNCGELPTPELECYADPEWITESAE